MIASTDEAAERVAALSGPYQRLLDEDTREVPAVLRLRHNAVPWHGGLPVERYTSRAYHELEKERLWPRVWQFACREEHLPDPATSSSTTSPGGRTCWCGRRIARSAAMSTRACTAEGAPGLRRSLRQPDPVPIPRLFLATRRAAGRRPGWLGLPQPPERELGLPQVRVTSWAGFVFLNPDPDAGSLEDFLGEIVNHFAGWDLGSAYVEAHIAKVIHANWKVAQEAFCEAYHMAGTPQILPWLGDLLTQVDIWDNFSRAITPGGVTSPHLTWVPSEEEMLRSMLDDP